MSRMEYVVRYVTVRICWLALGAIAGIVATPMCGCRSVRVEKHDPEVIVSSNSVIVVEGGWEAKYWSYGMLTSLGRLDIGIATNRAVTVSLTDLHTDMSTNHVIVIDASGKSAADIASKVIEALK